MKPILSVSPQHCRSGRVTNAHFSAGIESVRLCCCGPAAALLSCGGAPPNLCYLAATEPLLWSVLLQGASEGYVRFNDAESASKALDTAGADGKLAVGEGDDAVQATIALVTGDAEQQLIDQASRPLPLWCSFQYSAFRCSRPEPTRVVLDFTPLSRG